MIGLAPIKCQKFGCMKYLHHACSIEWVSKNNLPEKGIATLCRGHHPQYQQYTATAAATAAASAAKQNQVNTAPVTATVAANTTDDAAVSTPTTALQIITSPTDDMMSPLPSAAAAAAATVAAGLSMSISTVDGDVRAKSPIASTATQINATTVTKRRINKKGEIVAATSSTQPKIKEGIRVFSTKEQLIVNLKQGDPAYELVKGQRSGFIFYGNVLNADAKKGWYNIAYDLFPENGKSLRLTRNSCRTMRPGQDEPQYDSRHDKVDKVLKDIEILEPDPEDFDLALPDSDIEGEDNLDHGNKKQKRKRRKTRKVLGLESFMNMSDEAVLEARSFHHYHGEDDNDFIEWTILREGEEIVDDVMTHVDRSPFAINIPWKPEVGAVDYFTIFFKYFFPPLEGKAAILDKYLSDPRCSGHTSYYVNEKVRFHRPDKKDPDYLVSSILALCRLNYFAEASSHIAIYSAQNLCGVGNCRYS